MAMGPRRFEANAALCDVAKRRLNGVRFG